MGMDAIEPSGKIGLGTSPNDESNPFRLMMTRFITLKRTLTKNYSYGRVVHAAACHGKAIVPEVTQIRK
jgi:hypothetical protein